MNTICCNTVTAGDHVKFNFPMAYSVTLLTMGMLRYKAGYEGAGEWQNALNSIKCPLEYFIKCHASSNELYVQVCGILMLFHFHTYYFQRSTSVMILDNVLDHSDFDAIHT